MQRERLLINVHRYPQSHSEKVSKVVIDVVKCGMWCIVAIEVLTWRFMFLQKSYKVAMWIVPKLNDQLRTYSLTFNFQLHK